MRLSPPERTLLGVILLDIAMNTPRIGLGLLSGSASAIGDAMRLVLFMTISAFSLTIMMAINRRKFSQFEFGLEKLQIMVQIVIGLGMGFSALFIATRIVTNLTSGGEVPNYVFTLLFALASYISVNLNIVCLVRMIRANRQNPSIIMHSQIRKRWVAVISTSTVTMSTAAVVIPDPALFTLIDSIGAAIVLCAIVYTAVDMLTSGVLTLLDAPIEERNKLIVIRQIVDHFDLWSSIGFIRTRRLGYNRYIEIGLCFDEQTPVREALRRCQTIKNGIIGHIDHAFVSVFPIKPTEAGGHPTGDGLS